MTKHTPGPCSCKIVHTVTDAYVHAMSEYPNRIEFCPLHKAALELLEALKHAHTSLRTFSDHVPDDEKGWTSYDSEVLTSLEAAIAKADGH